MTDAQFLVSDEVVKIQLQKQQEQDNLVRRVARDIAQQEVSIQFMYDVSKTCKTARLNIIRLRKLGFRCKLMAIHYVETTICSSEYESEWLITLPQH